MEKGCAGYIKKKRSRNLAIILAFAVVIVGLIVAGLILFKTKNNYCTLLAVVLCLPAAKFVVNYIVVKSAKPINKDFLEKLNSIDNAFILYDLIISGQNKPESVEAAIINGNNIYLYSKKINTKDSIITDINKFLKNVKINANINVVSDNLKFIEIAKNKSVDKNDIVLIKKSEYVKKEFLNMCI